MKKETKLKYKKGDIVQVYLPTAAIIKRTNKELGYTLENLPCQRSQWAYYQDKDLVKINKKNEFYKDIL